MGLGTKLSCRRTEVLVVQKKTEKLLQGRLSALGSPTLLLRCKGLIIIIREQLKAVSSGLVTALEGMRAKRRVLAFLICLFLLLLNSV